MFIIFFIILVDLIGFGIFIPIMVFMTEQLGATPAQTSLILSLYLAATMISAPLLGRLSDRFGRRPVLMISMIGATMGYLLMASAQSLWVMALARVVSGLMAGNISTAQAYISDITTEENRAKGMGLIGAAFGLGFIIGPALGGLLAGSDFQNANYVLPALVSAGLAFTSFLTILFILPESLSPQKRAELRNQPQEGRIQQFRRILSNPIALQLILCGALYSMCAGLFESIFPLWAEHHDIVSGPRGLVPILLAGGFVLVVIQGGLIGRLTKRFGERALLIFGAIVYIASHLVMPTIGAMSSVGAAMAGLAILSIGTSFIMTSTQSLVSQCAKPHEYGAMMGVYNSIGTAGRFLGTLTAGTTFMVLGQDSNYYISAFLTTLLLLLALNVRSRWNESNREELSAEGSH